MQVLFRQEVFRAGGRVFRWEDVVLAAELWGDWNRIKERALQNLAFLAFEDAATGATVPEDEIDKAADDFRYERDLITAEELERWLSRWHLDTETWLDWISASLLRDRLPDVVLSAQKETGVRQVESAVLAEAVCSGELERLARRLAARAAIAEREKERNAAPPTRIEARPGRSPSAGRPSPGWSCRTSGSARRCSLPTPWLRGSRRD